MDGLRRQRHPRKAKQQKRRTKRRACSHRIVNYKEISTTSSDSDENCDVSSQVTSEKERGGGQPTLRRRVKAAEKEVAAEPQNFDESFTLRMDSSSDNSNEEVVFLGEVLKKPARSIGTTGQNYEMLMGQDSLSEKWDREKDELLVKFLIQNLRKIQACDSVCKVLQESGDSILRGAVMPESLIGRIKHLAGASQYVYLITICGGDKLKNENEKHTFLERVESLRKFMTGLVR